MPPRGAGSVRVGGQVAGAGGVKEPKRLCAFAGSVDKILSPSPGGSKFNREMYIFNCLAYYGFYIELFWTYLVYGRKDWP